MNTRVSGGGTGREILGYVVCLTLAVASVVLIIRTDAAVETQRPLAPAPSAEQSAKTTGLGSQSTPLEMPHPDLQQRVRRATVRVINETQEIEGSGFLVATDVSTDRSDSKWTRVLNQRVITAGHMLSRLDDVQVEIGRKLYPAVIVAHSLSPDVAVLEISTDESLPYLNLSQNRIGTQNSQPGWSCGIDDNLRAGLRKGRAVRKSVRIRDDQGSLTLLEFSEAGAHGRSGGPLVDKWGRVIGVASGISNGKSYFTPIEDIDKVVNDAL